jgi:hypothetical protein
LKVTEQEPIDEEPSIRELCVKVKLMEDDECCLAQTAEPSKITGIRTEDDSWKEEGGNPKTRQLDHPNRLCNLEMCGLKTNQMECNDIG